MMKDDRRRNSHSDFSSEAGLGLSRREVLRSLAAVGAGAMLPARSLFAQDSRTADGIPTDKTPVAPLTAKGGAIDVHHHYLAPLPGAVGNPHWTPEMSLEVMDKYNIAAALLSLTMQRELFYDGTEKGRAAIRKCNDYAAKIVQKNPNRFGLLAGLPFPDVEGSLKEIEYVYDTLKVDGIGIYSSTGDRWPGDPMFEPIMQELNRRKAPVLVHSDTPNCCGRGAIPREIATGELDFDEARCAQSLLVNGILTKYPDIKFIMIHAGGVIPVMAGRIRDRYPHDRMQWVPNGSWAELRKLYYEIAHGAWRQNLLALKEFVPTSQVLFGTDFTPEPVESTIRQLPNSPYSQDELQQIERGNAEKMFPRFKV
jgi:6-methylsalicylate decarboxylase